MRNGFPEYACPHCGGQLLKEGDSMRCPRDSLVFPTFKGIPDFILPERRATIERYLTAYRAVRSREQWPCASRQAFERLPFASCADPNASVWRLRGRTFHTLLADLEQRLGTRPLRILDAGAGNGWLSYHLSRWKHHVVAQDILVNSGDGLATVRDFYGDPVPIVLVRAEFDFPPFMPRSFDVIIFNASLHHAPDPYGTIVRTMNLLDEKGALYITDSPEFRDSRDGELMLAQRAREFSLRHSMDFPSGGKGYLLSREMEQLRHSYAVERKDIPFGLAFTVRRMITRIRLRRRAASFPFYVITRPPLPRSA